MTTSTPTSLLGRLLNGATTLSRIAIWIAGGLTLLRAIYITLDVLSRKFLNSPLGGSANIRIDAIYQHLPVRIAAFLDWVALVALAVFIVYLTRYAAEVAGMSWESQSTANTILGTPLWIPQTLWAAGLVWLCVVLALMLIRASLALVTGNLTEVQRICGIRTTKEEASAEAESGKRLVQMEQQS